MRPHTYYRGGGYGYGYVSRSESSGASSNVNQQPQPAALSESPTVSDVMIRDVLFPGDPRVPSKQTFNYTDSPLRRRYDKNGETKDKDGARNAMMDGALLGMFFTAQQEKNKNNEVLQKMSNAYVESGKDEVVNIREEEQPVIISSIPYFWGAVNLPRGDNDTDCVDFSAANDASNFTICNVSSLIRCQKSLSEVFVIGKKPKSFLDTSFDFGSNNMVDARVIVKTANGTLATEFAWFCPPSDRCCEWECCSTEEKQHTEFDPPDDDFRSNMHMLLFFGFLFTAVLVSLCCCKGWQTCANKAEETQPQQRIPERQPLTAAYPRQLPPSNPAGGNYGWNTMPSAPPMYKDVMAS